MAMHMAGIRMKSVADRAKLLETLRANLKQHAQIVKEAREGYMKQAHAALEERLRQLDTGELVSLTFYLAPPLDYSEVYENSIAMLEWHTEPKVELAADEFRQLVRDEWDWTDQFLASNRTYSSTAATIASSKLKS